MPDLDEFSETETHKHEIYAQTGHGIAFLLPSRRRFIPYVWLLFSELNKDNTELRLHYTHAVVVIVGTRLLKLQEAVENFKLRMVRELPPSSLIGEYDPTVTRIEINEKIDD
jgi:hypothetical protein